MEELLILSLKQAIYRDVNGFNETYHIIHKTARPSCIGTCSYALTIDFWEKQSEGTLFLYKNHFCRFTSCSKKFCPNLNQYADRSHIILEKYYDFIENNIWAKPC